MISRRHFLRASGAAGLSAMLGGNALAQSGQGEARPNIVWLSTEDIGPHLGCYGDALARTPHLDRLAAEGRRYTNAFTVAPVCAPNRSSIITGVHASTLGSHQMRSGGEGKNGSKPPVLSPKAGCFPALLREAGYYCTNNSKEDYNFVRPDDVWDESSGKAHWRKRSRPEQPFFAVFNFTGTHEGQVRKPRGESETPQTDPASVVVPPYHPDTPVVRGQWASYYDCIAALDVWIGERLDELKSDGLLENTIVLFWSDHGAGLPRCKRWLYDSGTHVPVIAWASARWTDLAGITAGSVSDELVSSLDFAPSTLRLAGVAVPDYMQGQPFLGPDRPEPREFVFAARDRMDERYDMIRMARDKRFLYIRNYMPYKPYNQYLDYAELSPVRQELRRLHKADALPAGAQWFGATRKPVEELYDTETDPHNLRNIAGQAEYAGVLARLRTAHDTWAVETRDLGLLPEPELNRLGHVHGTRYDIYTALEVESPGFWSALRDLAARTGDPGAGDEPALIEALKSPHPAMRRWAVEGIAQLKSLEPLRLAVADESTTVRVAAAAALARDDAARPDALHALEAALADKDEWIRVQAATALDELGELARPSLDSLRKALDDRMNKYVVRIANHAVNALTGSDNRVT